MTDQLTPTVEHTHDVHPVAAAAAQVAEQAAIEPTPPALTPEQQRMDNALKVIDQLREAVATGKVTAFAGVVLMPDDNTGLFVGTPSDVTRLRLGGALLSLQSAFYRGEI